MAQSALTFNGLPFTPPRFFQDAGTHGFLFGHTAVVAFTAAIGDLVNVKAGGTAVQADASTQIKATGVVIRVSSPTLIWWAESADVEVIISGLEQSGEAEVWLGEAGKPSATPSTSGLIQRVGKAHAYDGTTTEHRVIFSLAPAASVYG